LIFSIIICALVLNSFVILSGLSAGMVNWIETLSLSPIIVILIILGFYIILGTVIEGLAMIFLTVPIFVPIVEGLGFDLVWFGIVMVMVVEISLITPPIGLNVFVLKSMLPDVALSTIFKGIIPFFVADIFRLLLVVFFPGIALFLPSVLS
jgi:C4-dicarboxylate transporter DctM subunit